MEQSLQWKINLKFESLLEETFWFSKKYGNVNFSILATFPAISSLMLILVKKGYVTKFDWLLKFPRKTPLEHFIVAYRLFVCYDTIYRSPIRPILLHFWSFSETRVLISNEWIFCFFFSRKETIFFAKKNKKINFVFRALVWYTMTLSFFRCSIKMNSIGNLEFLRNYTENSVFKNLIIQ